MNVALSSSRYESVGSLADFVVPGDYDSEDDPEWLLDQLSSTQPKRKRLHKLSDLRAVKKPARGNAEDLIRNVAEDATFRRATALKSPALRVLGQGSPVGPVVGRNEEARRIIEMVLQPHGGVRPLLLGPGGIGKLSIVDKVATLGKTVYQRHPLGGRDVVCVDCNLLLANCIGENRSEQVAGELQFFVNSLLAGNKPSVFYFRGIEKLFQLDQVAEYVQSMLKMPFSFIASFSGEANEEQIAKAKNILSNHNFVPISVEELPQQDVIEVVRNWMESQRIHPSLSFAEESLRLGVRLAGKYLHTGPFPLKAVNLLQTTANRLLLQTILQNGQPDVIQVQPGDVIRDVSYITKITAKDLREDTVFNERRFAARIRELLVGQDHVIDTVCEHIACYKMGLLDPKKPWGVFLFPGPTGVGKTELAKILAKLLFHNDNILRINGSEFKESHTTATLLGSPPGYMDHEIPGKLTEKLLNNPHQVVLLDEFEKAHEDVRMLFLQIFDEGTYQDRSGPLVDCSQALFIVTSNIGSDVLFEQTRNGELDADAVEKILMPILVERLTPELCNRFTAVVPFKPLTRETIPDVVRVQLKRTKERFALEGSIDLCWTEELVRHFVGLDVDFGFGMRHFCRIVDREVVSAIKEAASQIDRRLSGKVTLDFKNSQFDISVRGAMG